jgi:hypothetical protein
MDQTGYRKLIKAWKTSEDYAKQYVVFNSMIDQVVSVYKQYKDAIIDMECRLDELAVRTEIGSASDLHRGYYCPSLVYDIYIGNVKRGKLLKRLTSKSKRYYVYGFDQNDLLIWCKEYSNAALVTIECFVYEDGCRYGFSRSVLHPSFSITQEKFEDNRITSYLHGHGFQDIDEMVWVEWLCESYHYDTIGLKTCDVYRIKPMILNLTHEKLVFERDNGFLRNYHIETLIGFDEEIAIRTSPTYDVFVERRA